MPALLALHHRYRQVAEHAEICGRCVSNVAGDGEQRKFRLMSKSICSTGLRWLWWS